MPILGPECSNGWRAVRPEAGCDDVRPPMRFDVYGLFDIECGLRVAAENTVRILQERGQRVAVRSIRPDGRVSRRRTRLRQDINLFHVNPNWIELMFSRRSSLNLRRSLNVCVVYWELPRLPRVWLPLLRSMDVLLAPTQFIADSVSASLPEALIVPLPQAVSLPAGVAADRQRFGVPEDATVFCMSLAADSGIDRKNPWAAVEAFLCAFPDEPDVRLLVRLQQSREGTTPEIERLLDVSREDSRVVPVLGELDYRGVLSLYASSDVYVSLHRSEGLGLGPMEAMALGKVVVATGWSGNMQFMDDTNSCPVAYKLVELGVGGPGPYQQDSFTEPVSWAEPNIEDAAETMYRLYRDPELRRELGDRARESMRSHRQTASAAQWVDDLADARLAIQVDSAAHVARAHEFLLIRRTQQAARIRAQLRGLGGKLVRSWRRRRKNASS